MIQICRNGRSRNWSAAELSHHGSVQLLLQCSWCQLVPTTFCRLRTDCNPVYWVDARRDECRREKPARFLPARIRGQNEERNVPPSKDGQLGRFLCDSDCGLGRPPCLLPGGELLIHLEADVFGVYLLGAGGLAENSGRVRSESRKPNDCTHRKEKPRRFAGRLDPKIREAPKIWPLETGFSSVVSMFPRNGYRF